MDAFRSTQVFDPAWVGNPESPEPGASRWSSPAGGDGRPRALQTVFRWWQDIHVKKPRATFEAVWRSCRQAGGRRALPGPDYILYSFVPAEVW